MGKLRILIADDHAVLRRGLRSLLESHPGWEVCAEAATGRETVEEVRRLNPDVVVLDITMPELNGIDATKQILRDAPRTEVLILTVHNSEEVAREVLGAGARGYLVKSDAASMLISAVERLGQHKPFLTPSVTEFVLDVYVDRGKENPIRTDRVTSRERQVIQLVAEGKSNKEIAGTLGIALKTAEAHRWRIMHKLNLNSVSDLVRYAIRNRIVQP